MSTVLSLLASAILAALGRIGVKLVTPEFFEAVITRGLIWSLEKLAPLTTNKLDDQIVAEIKKRLGVPDANP